MTLADLDSMEKELEETATPLILRTQCRDLINALRAALVRIQLYESTETAAEDVVRYKPESPPWRAALKELEGACRNLRLAKNGELSKVIDDGKKP